ncbi:MAG: sugar kinase, partial [Acidimicrobiia bacterium]|nr:sugar kinase [Acidimicrobiia bacterium]
MTNETSTAPPIDSWVSIGETMIAFANTDDPRHYEAVVAGAESNVAMGQARLGLPARWVSRLGEDPLGALVADVVSGSGVDVDVVHDPHRPTGVMTNYVTPDGTRGQYYRAGSAASALSVDD